MYFSAGLVALFALVQSTSATVDLTDATFEDEVFNSGRNSFVKFFAPWCGHCKKLKPDWDVLGEEFDGTGSVLVADVDCTVHQATCSKFDVSGYPTLKFFAGGDTKGQAYQGGRDPASLKKFITDTLQVICSVDDISGCDEKEQGYHAKWSSKDKSALESELSRLDGMKGKSMKAELKKWLNGRINILKQLVSKA